MSTIIKLKQVVHMGDRTITAEGEFEFDRDFLMSSMADAAIKCFQAALANPKIESTTVK